MNFRTNAIYTEKLSVRFGALSPKQLALALRDGRASARLVYEHLLAKHKNLRRTAPRDFPADCVMLPDCRILQVRMATSNGVMMNPHRQNGCGRRFNRLEHLEAARRLTATFSSMSRPPPKSLTLSSPNSGCRRPTLPLAAKTRNP